jgi:DUF1009 family protein
MIGIIAGDGDLPKLLVKKLNKKKISFIYINLHPKKILKKNFYNYNIFEISNILKALKVNNCQKVILVGKVIRPSIHDFKFDKELIKLLPKMLLNYKKGDGHLLDMVINFFKKNKITVISCINYLSELKAENFISINKPNKQDLLDINKGVKLLNHINSKFDVGQSAIINKGYVVAIEGASGTDSMIINSIKIQRKINNNNFSGVLIKIPKKKQDLRVDLPTIGYRTIKYCIRAGIKGIALKKNENIFLDQNKSIDIIKKNNFFIKVID